MADLITRARALYNRRDGARSLKPERLLSAGVRLQHSESARDNEMSRGVESVRLVAAARCAPVGTSQFIWRIRLLSEIRHSRLARRHGYGSFLGHFATALGPGRANLITVG